MRTETPLWALPPVFFTRKWNWVSWLLSLPLLSIATFSPLGAGVGGLVAVLLGIGVFVGIGLGPPTGVLVGALVAVGLGPTVGVLVDPAIGTPIIGYCTWASTLCLACTTVVQSLLSNPPVSPELGFKLQNVQLNELDLI